MIYQYINIMLYQYQKYDSEIYLCESGATVAMFCLFSNRSVSQLQSSRSDVHGFALTINRK